MMGTTHILIGGAMGVLLAVSSPEHQTAFILAGGFGGLLPDLDKFLENRKTLHFPVVYPLAVAGSGVVFLVAPSVYAGGLFLVFAAAGAHSTMDVLTRGQTLRPWDEQDDHAVYNHVTGTWIAPKRLLHCGSWKDLVIAVVAGVPLLLRAEPFWAGITLVLLGISAFYTLFHRRIIARFPAEYTTMSDVVKHWRPGIYTRYTRTE